MTAKSEKNYKRKSFLDVLLQNFNLHERNIFVHRLIYVGSFLSTDLLSHDTPIIEAFRRSIKLINDRYFDEKLSGFLLLYEQHFCHVLERLIEEWIILTATQSPYSDNDDLVKEKRGSNFYKKHCIEKLYLLGLSLRKNKIPEQHEDRPSKFISKRRLKSKSTSANKDSVVKVSVFLPELEYIKRLLEASDVSDLKKYLEAYDKVPHLDAYEEMVWPLPCEYMPMHTFKKDIEPIGSLGTLGDI